MGHPFNKSLFDNNNYAFQVKRRFCERMSHVASTCGVRFPPVAHMLVVPGNLVLALMDLHHVPNVDRQRRRFASHPHEALAWVLDS
jgi:hypothetical protein